MEERRRRGKPRKQSIDNIKQWTQLTTSQCVRLLKIAAAGNNSSVKRWWPTITHDLPRRIRVPKGINRNHNNPQPLYFSYDTVGIPAGCLGRCSSINLSIEHARQNSIEGHRPRQLGRDAYGAVTEIRFLEKIRF